MTKRGLQYNLTSSSLNLYCLFFRPDTEVKILAVFVCNTTLCSKHLILNELGKMYFSLRLQNLWPAVAASSTNLERTLSSAQSRKKPGRREVARATAEISN